MWMKKVTVETIARTCRFWEAQCFICMATDLRSSYKISQIGVDLQILNCEERTVWRNDCSARLRACHRGCRVGLSLVAGWPHWVAWQLGYLSLNPCPWHDSFALDVRLLRLLSTSVPPCPT